MRRGPQAGRGPVLRRGLAGLLTAEAVSLLGSRMSMLALPWFTLVTTGSAARTGVVAFAGMLPYVLVCALGGPVLDRVGARRASVFADGASVLPLAAVPVLHGAGSLHFAVLVALVTAAGLLRGFGDTAKRVVLPRTVEASGVDLTRATGLHDGISRLATLLGAPLAGVLVAGLGAPSVLLIDAVTFAFSAAVLMAAVPADPVVPADGQPAEPYLAALRGGLAYLRRDRLVRGITLMLLATNLFDQASGAVLSPVWAREVAGSPLALGLMSGALGLGAVLGNVVFTALAPRVPRYATFALGFLVGGAPRFVSLALADELWVICLVAFTAGLGLAAVNPILGAVLYERVPPPLQARVMGLGTALAFAGIPAGGLLGGWLVQWQGLTRAALVFGGLYLAVTLVPFLRPAWRDLDRRPPAPGDAQASVPADRRRSAPGDAHEDGEQQQRDGGREEDERQLAARAAGDGGHRDRFGR